MARGRYFRGDSDMVLIAGGKRFDVHRKVLSSSSPVFKRMLRPDAEGNPRTEVSIEGVDAARMGLVLDYLYSGSLRLCCADAALTMLSPAQKFLLDGLTDEIERYLADETPPRHFVEMYRYADVRGLAHLREEFMDRIADDLPRFAKGPAYARLEIRLVELLVKHAARQAHLIKEPPLRAEFELEVVEAITRWLLAPTPSSWARSKSRGPNTSFDRTRSFGSNASFDRSQSRGRTASFERAIGRPPNASFDGVMRGAPNSSFDGAMRGAPNASFDGAMRAPGPNASFDHPRLHRPNMSGDREMSSRDEHNLDMGPKPWNGGDPRHAGNMGWGGAGGAGRRGWGGETWYAEEDDDIGDEPSTDGSHQDMRVRDGATPYSSGRKWAPMGMLKAPWRGGGGGDQEEEHSEDESDEGYGPRFGAGAGAGEGDRRMRRSESRSGGSRGGGTWFDRLGRDDRSMHSSDEGMRGFGGMRNARSGSSRERSIPYGGGDYDEENEEAYGGSPGYGGMRNARWGGGGGRSREGDGEDGYGGSRWGGGVMNGFGGMRNVARGRYGEDAASEDGYDGRRGGGGGSTRSFGSGRGRYGEDGGNDEEGYDWRRGGGGGSSRSRGYMNGRRRYGEDGASEEEGRFGRWARRPRDEDESDSEDSEELHERREKAAENAASASSEDTNSGSDSGSGSGTDEDFTTRGEGGRWKVGAGGKCRKCLLAGKHLVRQGHLLSEKLADEDRVHYEERLFRAVNLHHLERNALRRVGQVAESKDLPFLGQLVEIEMRQRGGR